MDKSQILPNRKEYRASMRKFKHLKVAKKTKTKGAFGSIPEYIKKSKKKKALKKIYDKGVVTIETKEVTTKKTQPVENKEVKIPYIKDNPDLKGKTVILGTEPVENKEVKNVDSEHVDNKEVKEKTNE